MTTTEYTVDGRPDGIIRGLFRPGFLTARDGIAVHPRRLCCVISIVVVCLATTGALPAQSKSKKGAANTAPKPRWNDNFSVTWDGVDLRTAVESVSRAQGVPVLLDRRIDSARTVTLRTADTPLKDVLAETVRPQRGNAADVADVVYLGPAARADWLRSVVAARTEEWTRKSPAQARRRFPLRWDDVSEPKEILQSWATSAEISIQNLDRIPHDLWPTFPVTEKPPELTFVEGACLLLVGFDLAFEWRFADNTTAIEIVPFPDRVERARSFPAPKGQAASRLVERAQLAFPDLDLSIERTSLIATGREEDLDSLADWLKHPEADRPTKPTRGADDLASKRFTLAIDDVPLKALLDTLSRNPDARLVFDLDEPGLANAGVRFDRRVSIDVKQATIDELLAAIGKQIGVTFTRDDRKVSAKKATTE